MKNTFTLGSDDEGVKQNGLNESMSNKSSSFIPSAATSSSNDDNEDDGLVIGSTTLPATVPLVIERTQIDNDDQIEIISSSRTEKIVEEDDNKKVTIETTSTTEVEIDNTQAYTLKPSDEEQSSKEQLAAETQAYELEPEKLVMDTVETKREEVRQLVVEGDKIIEKIITKTTTTTTTTISENDDPPMETQAYDLEPTEQETTTTVLIDNETRPVETQAYDLQPTYEETTTTTTTTTVVETVVPATETLAYDLQPGNDDNTDSTTPESKSVPAESAPDDLAPKKEEIDVTATAVENNTQPSTNQEKKIDTNEPAVCDDTQQYDLDEQMEDSSPRPASETFETVPMSKLVEQIQTAENVPDETATKQQVEVKIDQYVIETKTEDEKMDTNQTGKRKQPYLCLAYVNFPCCLFEWI